MTKLLVNPKTAAELKNFLLRPSHALLLAGAQGSGRLSLAMQLASDILGVSRLVEGASYKLVSPDEKDLISINQIRDLKQFTQLKNPRGKRVIVIDKADRMQNSAQNSFLKLLEEPPENTTFILTSPPGRLKPTILSRLQQIIVRPVSLAEASDFFSGSSEDIKRAYRISGGRLGAMSQILSDVDGSVNRLADRAKQILTSNSYQRLLLVNDLTKDKSAALSLLDVLGRMATAALAGAQDVKTISRWKKVLAANYKAEASLSKNLNTKLVLTDLMLNL